MLIQELTNEDNLNLLAHMHLGRLACAQGAQPYVVPFYFAYQNNYLYSFATIGQRIEWMRANPLVCVETDEVASSEEWVSVIIFGRYEELLNTPERKMERELAYELLKKKQTGGNQVVPKQSSEVPHDLSIPFISAFRLCRLRVTAARPTPRK
jgi:nitroimidazol reductase NimA-like FMN-containing flavoprotein (pyridoxamine 5'-phosphate oxidase superfamily)